MKKGKKVIFLDIDGVLVNRASFRLPRTQCEGYKATHCTAHPICVESLNRIVIETDARIVISSVWRTFGVTTMRELFRHWGVNARIIGRTPDLSRRAVEGQLWRAVQRGEEIQAWLATHEPISNFVIIDDDSDMNGLSDRLVQTQFEQGLTDRDARQAITMLNAEVEIRLPEEMVR